MSKLLDKIIVVDVEATCWQGPPPPGQKNEIIEIGICVVDVDSLEREQKTTMFLQPSSEVSEFCTKLTTIKPEDLKDGISLEEACRILSEKFKSAERRWASWGDFDRSQFSRECKEKGVKYPFGLGHLNVKTLFSITHGLRKELGMEAALQKIKAPLEGIHHRGCDDAWNIARVLCHTLKNARTNIVA